ncbi:MAG: D-tyrosyl-tRNA(Tyr) deacylase [Candidatus Zixiibacteriota bacterium]|nr:MAG: D-tyrosyl-tRNA(Tyr) deacylase [candidate division Zixibacteria bacterium]
MRLLVQRTDGVELAIDGKVFGSTGRGLLVLMGTRTGDVEESCRKLADKVVNLRIFEDDDGKMNLSALDTNAEIMIVSQFTLYADTRKGRRPAFTDALEPVEAERLYDKFVEAIRGYGVKVGTGVFGARMDIRFNNTGPVTIILEHEV